MIENWRQASEEEQKFEQKDAGWLLMFSVIGCLCILPLGALGIWQAYDIYAIYEDGISVGFLITSLLCGVVMLLAVLVCGGYWKSYRSIRGGAVYCSHEGRVERTWQEKDDKSVLEYFSFTYRDMVTGEKKEHKSLNFGGKNRLEVGDALCVLWGGGAVYQAGDKSDLAICCGDYPALRNLSQKGRRHYFRIGSRRHSDVDGSAWLSG